MPCTGSCHRKPHDRGIPGHSQEGNSTSSGRASSAALALPFEDMQARERSPRGRSVIENVPDGGGTFGSQISGTRKRSKSPFRSPTIASPVQAAAHLFRDRPSKPSLGATTILTLLERTWLTQCLNRIRWSPVVLGLGSGHLQPTWLWQAETPIHLSRDEPQPCGSPSSYSIGDSPICRIQRQ